MAPVEFPGKDCSDDLPPPQTGNERAIESQGAITRSFVFAGWQHYPVFCTKNCIGSMSLSVWSSSWRRRSTGAFKTRHRSTWSTTASQSRMSPVDSIWDLPVVTS